MWNVEVEDRDPGSHFLCGSGGAPFSFGSPDTTPPCGPFPLSLLLQKKLSVDRIL